MNNDDATIYNNNKNRDISQLFSIRQAPVILRNHKETFESSLQATFGELIFKVL